MSNSTPHILDNPIWAALSTRQREFAQTAGTLLRYPMEIAPFVGMPQAGALDGTALEALANVGETLFLVGPRPSPPIGWRVDELDRLDQMACASPMREVDGPVIVPLDAGHRPAVLALTALVYPHFFRRRTMDLGRYFGIFEQGQLAAMIGERMDVPGFREVSAVCTSPDFVGRGLARRLLAFLTNDILQRGATPFLHVSLNNERARKLYAQNGYATRSEVAFWSLKPVAKVTC